MYKNHREILRGGKESLQTLFFGRFSLPHCLAVIDRWQRQQVVPFRGVVFVQASGI